MSNETPREAPLSKRTPTERRCRPARAAAVQRPDMAVGEAGREILERVTDGIVALDREERAVLHSIYSTWGTWDAAAAKKARKLAGRGPEPDS